MLKAKCSSSLGYEDWHRAFKNKLCVIIRLDDASRYALAGAEFKESTYEHSVETFRMV